MKFCYVTTEYQGKLQCLEVTVRLVETQNWKENITKCKREFTFNKNINNLIYTKLTRSIFFS